MDENTRIIVRSAPDDDIDNSNGINTRDENAMLRLARWFEEIVDSRRGHEIILGLIGADIIITLNEMVFSLLDHTGKFEDHWVFATLSHISFAICVLFVAESVSKLLVFGPGFIFRESPWWVELFDTLVIWITFSLEIILKGRAFEAASLLIILRLWRIVRLVDSVALSVKMEYEDTISELKDALEFANERIYHLTTERAALVAQKSKDV